MIHSTKRKTCIRWAYWFLLFDAVLAMGIGTLYLKASNLPADFLSRIFLVISFPSHFITLSFLALPLVALLAMIWPNRRMVTIVAVLSGSAVLVFLLIDSGVYSLYRFHLNGMVWNLVMSGSANEVLSLSWVTWLTFYAIVALLLAVQILFALFLWRRIDRLRYGIPVFALLVVMVLISHFLHAWADFVQYVPITRTVRTLPAFKPVTMKSIMKKLGFKPSRKNEDMLAVDAEGGLHYPLEELKFSNSTKPLNVLLIVIDSWRFDMLGAEITPNIWKFAGESWVFNEHYSAGNATRFGIFSLFYGLYGTYWHSFLAEQRGPVFVNELKKRGYDLGVFASATLTSPEFDRTVFVDVRDRIETRQDGARPIDRDLQITAKMEHFIETRDANKPFFGFLFYDTPHSKQFPKEFDIFKPSVDSVNFMTLDKKKDPLPIINNYKNSLRFVDSNVGEIIATLEKKGQLNNTVVIITGDHGEEFNDLKLGFWGHDGNFARYQTRTPLVLRIPGTARQSYNHTTTSLDVVPTLMKQLFACDTDPARYSNGTYLTDSRPRSFIHVSTWDSFALVDNKRICVIENKGGTEIVDCNYREMPGEKIDPLLSREAMEGMSRFYGRGK